MKDLILMVVGGVLVTVITSIFGIGNSKITVIEGVRVKKTGKWIIMVSVMMILSGLVWAGKTTPDARLYGYTLAGYGFLAFIVGKVITWFQKI